jgi:membrane protein implicated in regulation of membrane protease activity
MSVALLLLAGGVAVLTVLAMVLMRRWRRRIGAKGRSRRDAVPPTDPWQEAGRRASLPPDEAAAEDGR